MGGAISKKNTPPPTEETSVKWKFLPSVEEAKDKFKNDGTLVKSTDPGHLELRQLLEEPLAQREIGNFAKEIHCHEAFMCWVDLQEFKGIPEGAHHFKRSKANHIYHKYIQADAILEFGGLSDDERTIYKKLLEDSVETPELLTSDFFDKIQMQCFVDIYQNIFKRFKTTEAYTQLKKTFRQKYNRVRIDDFIYYEKLGEGGFGLVVHCKKKSTGKHYALKIQTKSGLLECFSDDMNRVDYEKQAFASCQHPFIVNLDYAFQTDALVMMALGLATAGDLQQALNNAAQNRLPEPRAKFYVAEVVLALDHLHSMGLMYRDLKPNNVLLDADGHIKLADLGGVVDQDGKTLGRHSEIVHPLFAAKFGPSASSLNTDSGPPKPGTLKRRMSVMGTFGYMAPEMVIMLHQSSSERKGYTNAVDWWSLGVTMFKLLTGYKPFEQKKKSVEPDDDSLFPSPIPAVKKNNFPEYTMLQEEVSYPRYIGQEAVELMKGLLNVNETERLGYGPEGVKKIKEHPFFEGIDWEKLVTKHQVPPYLPDYSPLNESNPYHDFQTMMTELGKANWLAKLPPPTRQKYFENWDFVSTATLKIEFGIANEMDQHDSNYKVRQLLGIKDNPTSIGLQVKERIASIGH